MKNKLFKLLSVVLTLAMAFSMFACITAHATQEDVIVDGVISPALASGTVNGESNLTLDTCVASHATRLYTVNTYETAKIDEIIVGENCRIYVQFFNADGTYKGGSTWKTTGTYKVAELNNAGYYFKITFSCTEGGNDAKTPPVEGLKLTVNDNPIITPPVDPKPEEPEVPDTGVKVKPEMTQGTIDQGAVNAAVTTRIHTANYIYVTDIQSVTAGDDYMLGFHFYDEDGKWMNGHIGGWQYGKKTGAQLQAMVTGATYVKIVLARKNNGELYPENFDDGAIIISLAEGLTTFTKPDLPEVKPELPPLAEDPEVKINFGDYSFNRGNGLANTFAKLNKGEKINVLYMGGSVTNGTGASERELTSWRGIVSNWFNHNAGNGTVNNVNVAYGDTCTLFGSYRLNAEILPQEPDLIFVEFAINDMYNSNKRGYKETESTMQFETIIRTIRKELPDCDIVTILTADKGTFNTTSLHKYAQIHENVSIAYDVPSIHVGRALANEIALTGNSWSSTYAWTTSDIAHPNDAGYAVYAGEIKAYLAAELAKNGDKTVVTEHTLPTMISDKLLDGEVGFIDATEDLIKASEEMGGTGFAYSSGATNLANSGTNVFKGGVFSKNETDELVVKFTGTEIAMIEYQPISGFAVKIDDGDYHVINRDSVKPVVLATDLKYGEHVLRIKPLFSSSSSSFHIQGFFTRNQTKATHKHTYGEYIRNNDATCNSLETETAFCEVCGIEDTRDIPNSFAQHKYTTYTAKDPAQCGKNATEIADCDYGCGKTDERDIEGTALNHEFENETATECIRGCGFTRVLGDQLVKEADGIHYYYKDGVKQTDYEGLVKFGGKWFYVKDGAWQRSNTGLVKFSGKWFYVVSGKWSTSVTKVLKKYDGKWFWIVDGKWNSKTEDLVKCDGVYFYIKGGKWDSKTATKLFEKNGTKFYIKGGKWNKATTLFKQGSKLVAIKSGKVTTAKVIIKYNGKKYYCYKGYAQTSKTGKVTVSGKTYTVKKGIVK